MIYTVKYEKTPQENGSFEIELTPEFLSLVDDKIMKGICETHMASNGLCPAELVSATTNDGGKNFIFKEEKFPTFYSYEGQFAKKGHSEFRYIYITYQIPLPAIINEKLISDFYHRMKNQKDSMAWELIGIRCLGMISPPSSKPEEKENKYKGNILWVKINDDENADEHLKWIPAIKMNDKIISAAGELINPDTPQDTRSFTDCPFPEFKIVKR